MTISPHESELNEALATAREQPSDFVAWDALEAQAERAQAPEAVAELYVEALSSDLTPATLRRLRERSLRFGEEWFGDDAPQMQALLVKALELEPTDEVIFERLVVALTAAGSWNVLLDVYERAINATDSLERRVVLLDDASKVARDLASNDLRGMSLLRRLAALRPGDLTVRGQLERLYERTGQVHELLLSLSARDQAGISADSELTARAAALWFRKLDSPGPALNLAERVLREDPAHIEALGLVEEIFSAERLPSNLRRNALEILTEAYDRARRPAEKDRLMRAGAFMYEGPERARLHREAARMLRERQPREALVELGEALVRAPSDEGLLEEIEAHAAENGLFEELADLLERAAGKAETALRKNQLLLRAAQLREGKLAQRPRAIALYESVLAQDGALEPAVEAGRQLDALYDAEDEPEARIEVLARLAELETVPELRRSLRGALAKVALARGDEARAIATYRERLGEDRSDREALEALIALHEKRGEHAALIGVLRERAALVGGDEAARDLVRVGRLYAEELRDLDKALAALSEAHTLAPELRDEIGVGELLDSAARREVASGARLSTALAEAYRTWLDDGDRALALYARALASEPALPEARAGLVSLLEDERARGTAADVLAGAYATSDDVEALLGLLPHRLAAASSGAERARLLRQAAQLEALRREAPAAAFEHACAALIEEPSDAAGDLELWRLAEQLDGWRELATTLRRAAERLEPSHARFAQLRVSEGELWELRLLDLASALEAYQAAARALPADPGLAEAVCRVAALLGRYGDAFEVVITLADRLDQLPDAPLALLEERAAESEGFRALCVAARERLEHGRLKPPVRRELLLRIADWYERKLHDRDAAERTLLDASQLGGPHAETLRRLALLQRRAPSRALFDTLLAAGDLHDRELTLLREAAELARTTLADEALERTVLERLVARSTTLLKTGQRSADGVSAEEVLVEAGPRLADKLSAAGEHEAELTLLRELAATAIAKESAALFAERAGKLALDKLGDSELAVSLYQRALELAPDNAQLLAAVSAEYDRAGRLDDLVVLRRRELAATKSVTRRLALRLELARVLGEIESRGGRLAALRDNLREAPGHEPSIDAAEAMLRQQGALADVYDLLSVQGAQLEATGGLARAAALWSRAAELADGELKDEERALSAYQKLAGLEHDDRALAALARIRLGRGEPALAVPWLERSLATRSPVERVPVRVRLARAHEAAGDVDAAMRALEGGVSESPDAFELRDMLADFYERNDKHAELAELLADSAIRVSDRALSLSYARRSAALFQRVDNPARSVDVLARAVEAQPDDRALKLAYVDALIAAGRLPVAREVIDGMVQEYGRRRSPERAELHLRLSRVAEAEGQIEEALAQLDTAASMDRSHPSILRALGELAVQAGQLDRAERAYRTLLLVVRKPAPGVTSDIGAAEVLYQLHRIAADLGQRDKAAELLESAVQTAVHSEEETARLKSLLLERGEPELLLRVLELRLSQVSSAATEAEVLSDLADVLESTLERKDEALEARLKALTCAPELDALHAATLRVARALGRERSYVEVVASLLERARRKDDHALVSDLALRAATVAEHALSDLEAASSLYAQVNEGTAGYVEAQFALARVAGKRGQEDEERAVLERIAKLPDEAAYREGKRDALYRLIELRVSRPETREEGLRRLSELLDEQPDATRASQILKAAYESDPTDLATLALLEQMARQSGDTRVLLDALERRVRLDDVDLEIVREATEHALALSELPRAEALLSRAVELAESRVGLASAPWAPLLLARVREQQGDLDGALSAFESAMQVSDPAESFELGLSLADKAARERDPTRARRIYELLRERDPADRRIWGPLLALYKDEGELPRMLEVAASTIELLNDPADRNALRMETARQMFAAGREDDGARLLEQVLAEDPDHVDAAERLADLYERRGAIDALVELLNRQLESARERKSPSVVPLSLKMGAMLARTRPEQAAELYRQALTLMPDDDALLRAAIEQADPQEHAEERAELITRYLRREGARTRPGALEYALWLVELRAEQLEPNAFEQALELAHRTAPEHAELRERLMRWHRDRGHHARLAELLESEATQDVAPERAVALLMEAADVRLDLGHRSEAAALLRKARELAPDDLALLKRAVHTSASSGELGPALAEIDAALGQVERRDGERVELLLLRAEVSALAGAHDDAVEALTTAHDLGGGDVIEPLTNGLERARDSARERFDVDRERALTLRLARLYQKRGLLDRAIATLEAWTERQSDDVAALRDLLELSVEGQRFRQSLDIAEALAAHEEPSLLGHVAERLVEASRALEDPALARPGLERALERAPGDERVITLLDQLYRALGDKRALATLLRARLEGERDPNVRFEQLRAMGQLLVEAGDVDAAMEHLTEALSVRPDDLPTVMAVADAHIAAGRLDEARDLVERTMGALRQRRSPELAQLRLRMARIAGAGDDGQGRYDWLSSALDADMNNGEVASELAVVAQEQDQLETALKALRAITMMKGEAPMSRAEAFYRQAVIVARKGEPRRAVLWAKKAKAEDQHFPGVDRLIAELESA